MNKTPVKSRILPPLVLAIFLLQAVFLTMFWRQQQKDMAQVEVETTQRVQDLIQEELERDVAKMDTAMEVLIRDAELANALAELNRDSIIEQAQPIFEQFRDNHRITHFYFHQPDQVNFLRLHKERKGDLIDRATIQAAGRTGRPSAGLEQGPTGNPVLRLVYPWRSDFSEKTTADLFADKSTGELLGYLELGIEFEDITERVHELLKVDLIVAVDKVNLDQQRWASRNERLSRQSNWDEFTDYVIIDKTIADIPSEISEFISDINDDTEGFRINQNGQINQVLSFPFNDIDGREIGYVIALKDVSGNVQQSRQAMWLALVITSVIGAGLVSLFYVFLGTIEKRLNERTFKLTETTDALSVSNAKLEEYSNQLEKKVQARTEELEIQNQTLGTTLRRLEATQAQLIEKEKMAGLGQLVAGVAHEINTPVGIGITAASTLSDETRDFQADFQAGNLRKSALENYFNVATDSSRLILNNLQRAGDLIRSFKQVAVDQSSLEKRRVTAKKYFKEVLESLKPNLKGTAHVLDVLGDETVYIESYPGAISQVITNLVMNSVTHAYKPGEKGYLSFDLRQSDDRLLIKYTDDGCGISAQHIEKIFEPFFTTARNQGGSGLGLHIIYNLVTQKLQGTILCESEVGLGTKFLIDIPITV